jgi:integrase
MANPNDFALVAMLGLLGLRIIEATGADIGDRARNTATASYAWSARAPGRAAPAPVGDGQGDRTRHRRPDGGGPILLNTRGARMERHAATRRLRRLAAKSVVRLPRMHPHMLRHTFVITMLDAGVDLRDVQIAARHADPRTTMGHSGSGGVVVPASSSGIWWVTPAVPSGGGRR